MSLSYSIEAIRIVRRLSFLLVFFLTIQLFSQTLWSDHNPYDSSVKLASGSILKLKIDEPVKIEYEYEDHRDQLTTVKLVPDKNLVKDLPAADANNAIVNKNKSKLISKSRIQFKIAVVVQEQSTKDVVEFRGTKLIAQASGKQRQQIQVSGRIHRSDISSSRNILSGNVANLVISVNGAPVPARDNINLKTKNGKPVAELSDVEQQQLILKYLNRVLGETTP